MPNLKRNMDLTQTEDLAFRDFALEMGAMRCGNRANRFLVSLDKLGFFMTLLVLWIIG